MRRLFHTGRALAVLAAVVFLGCGMRTKIQAEADLVVDAGEVDPDRPCGAGPPCDPGNLGGRTCESLGRGAGVLQCDPDSCNLDISECSTLVDGGRPGPVGPGTPTTPGLFGGTAGAGTGTVPGFFGNLNFGDGGFFGMGNQVDPDGDGGVEPGGNAGTGGLFGSGFFGGQ
jgi:hypothetical protein